MKSVDIQSDSILFFLLFRNQLIQMDSKEINGDEMTDQNGQGEGAVALQQTNNRARCNQTRVAFCRIHS